MTTEPAGPGGTSGTLRGDPAARLVAAGMRAAGAAVVGAVAWTVLAGPVQLTWGIVAVAVAVGWFVGAAARSGAGGRGSRVALVAGAAGALAWLLALVGVYVYLAALPSGAAESGGLTGSPSILDFYAGEFGLLDFVEGVAVVVAAWWSAK